MVSLYASSSTSPVTPEEKLMEKQVVQLEEFFLGLKQHPIRNKRKRSYIYGHLLYDVEATLADCITSAMREEVMKLKNKIVMQSREVLGFETASTLAPAVEKMKRTKVSPSPARMPLLEGEVCAICQEEFKLKDEVTVLFCSHKFHEKCILGWLASSGRCPICRVELASSDDAA